MSNDKNNPFHGEILAPEVARKQIIEIGKTNRVAPEVGIFDAPVRCFRVNQQWWGLIAGQVHWLADVAAWQDADDESYPPILEILKFMQGVECADGSEPMLRQKPTDDCVLQQSLDNGETWTDVFDFSLCLAHQTTTITGQLQVIERQNIINSGYSPTTTTISGENGAYTESELEDMSIEAEICDDSGKDSVYGAVDRLVRYIHGKNEDFLQQITQAANISQQIDRAISATPVLGLLPADELVGYTGFIVDELSQEYNATVDEELLQAVICDLFCIAVNSDCMLSLNDVSNYFAGKVPSNFSNAVSTFLNFVQFSITGTFSGDDYFYYMCYLQIQIAMTKQRFLDIQSADAYQMQVQAGFNSPDNDWEIFCTECPTQYRVYTHDFVADGFGEFEAVTVSGVARGEATGNGIKGFPEGASNKIAEMVLPWQTEWRIRAAKVYVLRENGSSDTSFDQITVRLRTVVNSNNGSTALNMTGGLDNGNVAACSTPLSAPGWRDGFRELEFFARVHGIAATDNIYIQKIEILFEVDHYKPGAVINEDGDLCS